MIAMSAIYRTDSPPGPAGRWFIDRLKHEDAQPTDEETSPARPHQHRQSSRSRVMPTWPGEQAMAIDLYAVVYRQRR